MNGTPFRFPIQHLFVLGMLARKVIPYPALAALCVLASAAHAELNVENLVQAIKTGDVEIISITGNGGSSGLSWKDTCSIEVPFQSILTSD